MPAETKVTKSSKPAATVKKVVAKTTTPTTKAAPVAAPVATTTKKTTKKSVTAPVVAEPVETFEEVKKMTPIEPPHSIKINYYKKSIVAKITLHKIPDKCINLHPTPKKFYLDTLKFSKKFVLDIPYPENVTVDDEKATCSFDHDILTVFIPITSPLKEPVKKVDPKNNKKANNNKSDAAPVLVKRKQPEPTTPTTTTTTTTTTDKPAKKQAQKKQKVEEKPQEKVEEQTEEKEESEQTETTTQKKKKFIDNDSAIEFMNQISKEQEQKANQKIKDEKKKTQQQESKVENKQVKKASQVEKKENILKKLKGDETTPVETTPVVEVAKPAQTKVSKKPAPVATKKSVVAPVVEEEGTPSKKSVSFGEKVKVNVRNIPKVGKGNKLN